MNIDILRDRQADRDKERERERLDVLLNIPMVPFKGEHFKNSSNIRKGCFKSEKNYY